MVTHTIRLEPEGTCAERWAFIAGGKVDDGQIRADHRIGSFGCGNAFDCVTHSYHTALRRSASVLRMVHVKP